MESPFVLASLSSLIGSLWFGLFLGCVGFAGGWFVSRKRCGKCNGGK